MYDVMVIGGGSGGYAAAIRVSQLGGKVVLFEESELGGTCVNRGCMPTKVWLRAAYLLRLIRMADKFGIKASIQELCLPTIVARKNGVVGEIRMGMEGLLKNNGVDLIKGRAILKNPREVYVEGKTFEGRKIILAVGSCLDIPNLPGLKEAALTTNEILDMKEVPSPILIWGCGPIEVEMATLLNIFGSKVYLVMDHHTILPREDHGTSQRIAKALKEQGVVLFPSCALKSIRKSGSGFEVTLSSSKDQGVEVRNILISTRKPNTDNLGLKEVGVRVNENGSIGVNECLETLVDGIYAIGDATGNWMLSHASSSMAVTAAENAVGKKKKFPFHLVPRGLWTIPEVGAVGLAEEEAEKRGIKIQVGRFPYSINGLAMVTDEMVGSVKIISDANSGEIIGVHIVGAHATELVGEAVLAMQLESTAQELANSIRIHPTFSEAMVDAARDVLGWALYLPRR